MQLFSTATAPYTTSQFRKSQLETSSIFEKSSLCTLWFTLTCLKAKSKSIVLCLLQDILLLCWAFKQEERPSFSKLVDLLEKLPKRNRRLSHPGHFWKSAEYVKWVRDTKQQTISNYQKKKKKKKNNKKTTTAAITLHKKPTSLKNALNPKASPVMKTARAVCNFMECWHVCVQISWLSSFSKQLGFLWVDFDHTGYFFLYPFCLLLLTWSLHNIWFISWMYLACNRQPITSSWT